VISRYEQVAERPRRLAYADPPYLGCCRLYDHHHPAGPNTWDGRCWDDPETHRLLLTHLHMRYDGWAYSMTTTSLAQLLPLVPSARVGAWVKPFAAFKRNVRIAYTWEPVLFVPGRDSSKLGAPVGRDHIAESITMRKGFTGTKPEKVCAWILDLLGYVEGDTVDDLFPGLGVMGDVLNQGRIA
jgi:hypothetical protein